MKTLLLIFITAAAIPAVAQDSCNCLLNLDHMINKISHNYAGYKDKVNAATEITYNSFIDSLRKAATLSNGLGNCYKLLERYRLYFYDKHLQLSGDLPPDTSIKNETANKAEQTSWTVKKLRDYLDKNKNMLNPIEGVWQTEGYEIGIVFNKATKKYQAIILKATNKNWLTGMVKFSSKPENKTTYTTEYLRGDFVKVNTSAIVYKNRMQMEQFGYWQKTFPVVKDSITLADFNTNYGGQVQFRMLNDSSVYIRLKSCDLANKPILDSLINLNAKKLKTIPNWIVDFRGNEGGSTDVYQSLLPYFFTKTFFEKGDRHWMTQGNTEQFKKFVDENKTALDTGTLNYLNKIISFGEANPNGWHDTGMDSFKLDKVLDYPKHIAVLSDKNNASSGETFLLVTRGISDKAIIFGENSAGYMDYGDLLPYTFPCSKLRMYIPSRRSNYIDDGVHYSYTGIPPDVIIPAATKDWIQFVFDYWKKNKIVTTKTK